MEGGRKKICFDVAEVLMQYGLMPVGNFATLRRRIHRAHSWPSSSDEYLHTHVSKHQAFPTE